MGNNGKISKSRRNKRAPTIQKKLLKGPFNHSTSSQFEVCSHCVMFCPMKQQKCINLRKFELRNVLHFAEFSCLICRKVLSQPLTTPCAHNFCKACLEGKFAGKTYIRRTNCEGRRSLRARKNIMKCPSCPNDISDFLQNPQVILIMIPKNY